MGNVGNCVVDVVVEAVGEVGVVDVVVEAVGEEVGCDDLEFVKESTINV
jgi:hypothetical protein